MRITRNPFHSERGIALVMVMVVILAFGVLAASYAFSMKVEVRLAANTTRDPDMEWLGRSGIELARFVLAEKMQIPMQGQFDALSQMWAGGPLGTNEVLMAISLINVPLGEGMISVRIKDLERKININIADEPLLQRTMQVMGVDPFAADMIVDSVLDWMDPDLEPRLNGADGEAYLSEPNPPFPPYLTKNGPIDHITELLLIRGVEPSLYYGLGGGIRPSGFGPAGGALDAGFPQGPGMPPNAAIGIGNAGLRDLFTPIGGARVNVNTASEAVLSLIPGLDEMLARDIVQTRRGFDGVDGTEDDLPFLRIQDLGAVPGMVPELISILNRYCTVRSSSFEVEIETRLGDYRKIYLATLVRLGSRDVIVLNFYPL
ncbi:general secretion pathway protein GspK [bacterium]|jgi:type II secretory pathway component PulK|nr:general secretion pathway protein GspK [bacterium]